MPKIIVAFDVDGTLMNNKNTNEDEWIGSKEAWQGLCSRLSQIGVSAGVEIHFAIVSAKPRVDDLVVVSSLGLQDYLYARDTEHQMNLPAIEKGWVAVHFEGKSMLSQIAPPFKEVANNKAIISSIHVMKSEKSPSLKRLSKLFGVENYSNVFLVDDTWIMLSEAQKAGFSVISAEQVNHPDPEVRNQRAKALIVFIEKTISAKISELAEQAISVLYPSFYSVPDPKNLFFTKSIPPTPLQESLLKGFTTPTPFNT